MGLSGSGTASPQGVFGNSWELILVVHKNGVCRWCLMGGGPEVLDILGYTEK